MKSNHSSQSTIKELVRQNYLYASVLHFYGIHFYDYSDQSLAEACAMKGLREEFVIKKLEQAAERGKFSKSIHQLPVDIVLAYLIHTHHYFVNERLPLLVDMVANIEVEKFQNRHQANDLKLIFPLFVEDFIKHIHEEEETVFSYIESLLRVKNNPSEVAKAFYAMKKHSIADFACDHEDEDEMKGIRDLTNSFEIVEGANFYERQLITELKMLDSDFRLHATIEDDILFPKALELESKVNQIIREISREN